MLVCEARRAVCSIEFDDEPRAATRTILHPRIATMQTRADLYKYLDYYAYEAKLDELFAEGKEK